MSPVGSKQCDLDKRKLEQVGNGSVYSEMCGMHRIIMKSKRRKSGCKIILFSITFAAPRQFGTYNVIKMGMLMSIAYGCGVCERK